MSLSAAATVSASASQKAYFETIKGRWSGGGSIVAGKYKGTKFRCDFLGEKPRGRTGMKIDGNCRVGVFSQKMSAVIYSKGRTFRGRFLDGAKGKGLDIVSGRLSGSKLVVGINRKQLNGAMVARLKSPDRMHMSISVRVGSKLIPVIGLTLNRQAGGAQSTTRQP